MEFSDKGLIQDIGILTKSTDISMISNPLMQLIRLIVASEDIHTKTCGGEFGRPPINMNGSNSNLSMTSLTESKHLREEVRGILSKCLETNEWMSVYCSLGMDVYILFTY